MTQTFVTLQDIIAIAPEIFLVLSAMVFLLVGPFIYQNEPQRAMSLACALAMIGSLILLYIIPAARLDIFGGSFVQDGFSRLMKSFILFGGIATIFLSRGFFRIEPCARFEFPILIMLASFGMMVIISAHDFIALYIGLELLSLVLYILVAFDRRSVRSTEAGIKYFLLGALASGILLYGCALVYGFSGSLYFIDLPKKALDPGVQLGLIFIFAGLAFKVGAVPFHMWAPDVYEGAPTPAAMFLAAVPKIAVFAALMRLVVEGIPQGNFLAPVLFVMSVGSMALGAFAAIAQSSVRRLIAYSSIGHAGYALIGIVVGTPVGAQSVIIYLVIYMISMIGFFSCIMVLRRDEHSVERISDLSGLSRTHPAIAFFMAVILFSMAGIPPLAGFFGKFYIFLAAIEAGYYILALLGVLASAVAAYYYIRIVKLMYFDEADEPLDFELPFSARIFMGASALVLFGFVLGPRWLVLPAALVVETMVG